MHEGSADNKSFRWLFWGKVAGLRLLLSGVEPLTLLEDFVWALWDYTAPSRRRGPNH